MSHFSNSRSARRVTMSALSVLMLNVLPGGAAQGATAVPWLNQPAVAKPAAVAAAPTPAQACSSSDLKIAAGAAGAYRGQATQEIRITNTGAVACHLTGFPDVQLLPDSGAPQTVGASELAPRLASQRLDLAPGETVVMLLGTPGSCEAANKPQRKISKRLQVALRGGGIKMLDGVHIDTLCGRATVMQFQAVGSDAQAHVTALAQSSSLHQLAGMVSAPDVATRGGTLHYSVTLSNPTANPISLASCPAYTQSLYANGKVADSTLRLNCAAAGSQIAAHSSITFDMQMQVPADFANGQAKLSWKLEGGPGVGKMVDLR